ncbi:MAG: hypothetical protein IKR17_05975 [Bacteroidales bacterium]|nr:hypothetical protein [Bacteroidales bacterium]
MKKLTNRERQIRNKSLVDRMWADPNVFYRVQQNFEAMVNLVSMLDICVQDIDDDAPFLFHNKAHCFKDLSKALDACMEWLRKDPMLFGREKNDDKFFDQVVFSNDLLKVFKNILLRVGTQNGLVEVDSVVKLHLVNPNIEKYDRWRIAHETLRRHRYEFPIEYLRTWEEYEKANYTEGHGEEKQ